MRTGGKPSALLFTLSVYFFFIVVLLTEIEFFPNLVGEIGVTDVPIFTITTKHSYEFYPLSESLFACRCVHFQPGNR